YRQHAIVGIPLSQSPGPAQLTYHLNGEPRQHRFNVVAKTYTEQHITLENQAMVTPPPETLARIREELTRQRERYARRAPVENLANGFVKPLEGITTSLFGHRRFFNGQARNPHSGLDIAAPSGTPIQAPADATVTLADDLYFNGLTLFLDHGEGLITMYCHMSELIVGEGDKVVQGQVIGLVGTTGRSTGPHLHWTVSLNGTRVDPEVFLAQFSQVAAPR
ncbi:MAG: M23 family metallopeptidase, partial [Pseudomonadota bacterium]